VLHSAPERDALKAASPNPVTAAQAMQMVGFARAAVTSQIMLPFG
jgi:hypothetical protein